MTVSTFSKVLSGSELFREVKGVIQLFVDKDEHFPPYQETQQIRKNVGPTVEVVHNSVRDEVYNYMSQVSSYERYMKDYGGITATTFRPKQKKKAPMLLGGTGTLTVTSTNTTTKGSNKTYMYPKSEGRVTVPASALKQIGVKPGDVVGLTKCKELFTLIRGVHGHDQYKADKHGSIRLRPKRVAGYKRFELKIVQGDTQKIVQLVGEN